MTELETALQDLERKSQHCTVNQRHLWRLVLQILLLLALQIKEINEANITGTRY